MNCTGLNPVKLCKYKQHTYIIKMKEKKLNEIEKLREKNELLQKILVWKILLNSYLSLFHLDSKTVAWSYENAKAKRWHYFETFGNRDLGDDHYKGLASVTLGVVRSRTLFTGYECRA